LVVGLVLGTLSGQALAQLSDADIAALRERGKAEGWTFTVGHNEATRRPLSELCGAVEPAEPLDRSDFDEFMSCRGGDLPVAFDWRENGGCTPIRNQGGCGSCWAFSAVGAVECAVLINDAVSVNLSEQWLVSNCTDAGDCGGGWHTGALCYLRGRGNCVDPCGDSGAVLESEFPYIASNGPCYCPYSHPYWIDGYAAVGGRWDIEDIKQAIYEYGPVSATVAVNSAFQAYDDGVFNASYEGTINHAIVLVGWDDNQGSDGVWFLRNSWGSWWGEGGYMRIEYGCSKVGSGSTCVYYRYDCNNNGIRDDYDMDDCDGSPWCSDCDENGIIDECDIIKGRSYDCNENGVPDECEEGGFSASGRLHVDASATGAETGASWEDAITNVRTATCYAQTLPDVTEIWVARGTYTPGAYRTMSFEMRNGLTLRGGFAGTETSLEERDLSNPENRTILSGDLNGDDQPGFVNNADNSYHVVSAVGADATAVIDGFTIMGGNASDTSPDDCGGGMYNYSGSPTITNCVFLGNYAAEAGGAIRNECSPTEMGSSCPTIGNCVFSGNYAHQAGAISNLGTNLGPASPILSNCSFVGNSAYTYGGMYTQTHGDPTVANCIFWGNSDIIGQLETSQIYGNVTIDYSCVQGLTGDLGGTGNIDSPPSFVDADGPDDVSGTLDDNLHLTGGWAGIDAGDNASVPADVTDDLDGSPRFADDPGMPDQGNPPGGEPFVDMGAYEFQGTTCMGDLDGDNDVDLGDLSALLANYGMTSGAVYADGDLDGNGTVDLADLGALLGLYGQTCP
jgi:C1A family cysteine protease